MEIVDITFDVERSKKVARRYFKSEQKREFDKIPSKALFGTSAIFVLIGIISGLDFICILGAITVTMVAVFLIYYYIRFNITLTNFFKELEKKNQSTDKDFRFMFDSEMIMYKSQNLDSKIKWEMIKDYQENGTELYLFIENRELLDIISSSVLGADRFEKFKAILISKMGQKP